MSQVQNKGIRVTVLAAATASHVLLACGGSKRAGNTPPSEPKPLIESSDGSKRAVPASESAQENSKLPWAQETFSPQAGSTPEPRLEKAELRCGRGDAALHDAAQLLSDLEAQKNETPSLDVAKFHLMRLGSPYVMPRLWSAVVEGVSADDLAKSIGQWAKAREPLGEFRCGLGLTEKNDGSEVVTVLQVDVLADVKPIPTRVTSGTWLDFEAKLLAPTSAATVLLLPPEGPPRHLHTKLDQGRATARFSIETEGTWLIQLMATQSGGPRPVAQMMISADQEPPQSLEARAVPGESAFDSKKAPPDALFQLMNAARLDQGLPVLKRNRQLDRLAADHSRAMIAQGRISHDTGHGDPAYRLQLAGITPKATGENVALAASVVRLHRALWASPAHRENLLLRRWDEAGVAVIDDGTGSLYATQLFIDSE